MPFIEAGYINLFPDPCAFDRHLLEQMFNLAKERSKLRPIGNKDNRLMERLHKDDIERNMWMLPQEAQKQQLKRVLPHLTNKQVEETLEYFADKRQADHLSLLQDDALSSGEGGQLLVSTMSPNFEMSLYTAQATGSLIIADNQYRWEEIIHSQNKTDGVVSYRWSGLTNFIKGKDQVLSADRRDNFALRQSGKLRDMRNNMKKIYNAVTKIAPDNNAVDQLKGEFEMACSAKSAKVDETENSFKASFECLIPEGGITHNNVQRLLLSSGVENHNNNVPMAILVNEITG